MGRARASESMRYLGRLLALASAIGALAGIELWRSYHQVTSTAERSVAGLMDLLAEQTERTVQAIDLTLIGIRDALQVAPNLPRDDPAYRIAMMHRLSQLPYVRALFVVGPDGTIMHGTSHPATRPKTLADRPYFQAHQAQPDFGLHIGHPLRSRTFGIWFLSFTRRITNADGSFGGVVVAAVEPRYFKRFYEGLSVGEGDLIALLLRDGTLLARTPDYEGTIGKSYSESPLLRLAVTHGSGVTWSTSPVDGIARVVGYRALVGGSIVVFAGRSRSTVYDAWLEHAVIVSGGSILVWALTAGLAWLGLKYWGRERQELARLAQVQRLEMMGRIAGGIAHDLGNTVKIARTTFALLKPSLAAQRHAITLIEDADRSLKSAFDIIDRLLAFARRQELSPRPTNLAEVINGFAPILRQAAGPAIELDVDATTPLVCLIDPIHLESALLNLVLNSKDAMSNSGRIAVELRQVDGPRNRKKKRLPLSTADPWAEIVVRDNGAGMAGDVLDRVFEPFFTTRAGGSGLGLSQVLGFVQQSDGEIKIDSREGGGTTVRLLFPTTVNPLPSPVTPT